MNESGVEHNYIPIGMNTTVYKGGDPTDSCHVYHSN
jgi:hypothetical protein